MLVRYPNSPVGRLRILQELRAGMILSLWATLRQPYGPRGADRRKTGDGGLKMRSFVLAIVGFLLFGAAVVYADQDKPNLSGTWQLDQAGTNPGQTNKNLVLAIEETGQSIHIKETRGPNPKVDVSSLTCSTTGEECAMQDGGDKAQAFVYYNGPVLVVLKTHGRKGDSVEKRRLTLSPTGDSLVVEITHIEPQGKVEKLVLSKAR